MLVSINLVPYLKLFVTPVTFSNLAKFHAFIKENNSIIFWSRAAGLHHHLFLFPLGEIERKEYSITHYKIAHYLNLPIIKLPIITWTCNRMKQPATSINDHRCDYDCNDITLVEKYQNSPDSKVSGFKTSGDITKPGSFNFGFVRLQCV